MRTASKLFTTLGFLPLCISQYSIAASSLADQSSVVAASIKAETAECALGTTPGTVGHSINDAMKIHTDLASALPDTERLFSMAGDCFSGASQITDLSFSIPSLASIISSAQSAVLKYAQKKACTTIKQIPSMVTGPINQSMGTAFNLDSFTDLNGLSNDLAAQGLTMLDPELGSSYHDANPAGDYVINADTFSNTQTDFPEPEPVPAPAPAPAPLAITPQAVDTSTQTNSQINPFSVFE